MACGARGLGLVAVLAYCKPDLRTADLTEPRPPASPPAVPISARGPGDVPTARPPDGVDVVLGLVDAGKLRASVDRLAAFGTRHTLSDTVS